jgi:hypothetical protein
MGRILTDLATPSGLGFFGAGQYFQRVSALLVILMCM